MHKRTRKKTTALARRPKARLALPPAAPARMEIAVAPPQEVERALRDQVILGELGLVELKLTDAEEKILAEPAPIAEIQIKPTAHPQPYLSHPTYTRWLNRAFGRTGWALVPVAKPMLNGTSVVCPYVLYVHGKPVAFAMGEQEYHATNKEQTYGDALESTVASALRRCAKRLGIGLEMWDRAFLERWIYENAVKVKVSHRGETVTRWRLKNARALPGEMGIAGDDDHSGDYRGPRREAPAGHHAAGGEAITDKQRKRLFAIIRNSGRDEQQVRAWLTDQFPYTQGSTRKITRDDYEYICAAVESRADLPTRRPGQEG